MGWRTEKRGSDLPGAPGQRGQEGALVILLAALAGALRLYRLDAVPPGLHHDEAVNGLDILVTIPSLHPIFFEANNGREPLFIYLQALAVHLLGPSAFALRLTAAVVGILTVLSTYWLAREWFDRRVALLAGLGLAVSFWHVDLSRVGLRAIAAPLFLTIALACLARGLRKGGLLSFAAAGLATGLGLYTYLSARMVPFILLAILVWELARGGRAHRGRWIGLLVGLLVAVAVTAPLGRYFVDHPGSFAGRSAQVSIFNPTPEIEGRPSDFADNLRRTLGMFFVAGDDNPRHNVPGRPLFDLVGAPWLILGLAVACWQAIAALLRRGRPEGSDGEPSRPAAAGWLLIWSGAMLGLGTLAHESPNFLRLTSLAPAVYVTWALGLAAAWRWGERVHLSGAVPAPVLAALLAVGTIGYEAARTYHDYFDSWAGRADVYRAFDAGLVAVARHVEALNPDAQPILYLDRSPTVLFLSPRAREGRWLQGYTNVLLLPSPADSDAVYYFPAGDVGARTAGLYFARREPGWREADPAGQPVYVAYQLPRSEVQALAAPSVPSSHGFGDATRGADLLGHAQETPIASPGDRAALTLLWRLRGDVEMIYAPYVHVLDAAGRGWGQDDKLAFAVGGWKRGDLILSRHEWLVPGDAPPLTYDLLAGMAVRQFGWPPGPVEALGPPTKLAVTRIDRSGPSPRGAPGEIGNRVGADLGSGLELLGYDASAGQLKPGDRLKLDLLWRATRRPERDALVELSLLDGDGRVLVAESARPAYGEYPTDRWQAGGFLRDPRSVPIPASATAGSLRILVRTVDAASGRPLGEARLGAVEVIAPARRFDLPKMQRRIDADFGGEIALRGFDVDRETLKAPGALRLTLYWQALRTPSRSYTVFTHLLDAQGRVVAQQDAEPVRGAAPTLGWVPGQVVEDEYELKLERDPGGAELALEVGLYDARTGERLKLAGQGGDHVVLLRLPVAAQ